jgi:hypothetical protein
MRMPRKFVALTFAVAALFAVVASSGADTTLTIPGIL